jgi:hypothetical protein
MRGRLLPHGAVQLLAILVCGCANQRGQPPESHRDNWIWADPTPDCTINSPRFLPRFRASDTVSAPTRYDSQRISVWVARQVPGGWSFGPMVDSIRNITRLWMRDPALKREALAVLDTILPPNLTRYMRDSLTFPLYARTYPDSVLVGRVRWDYAELYDWMQFLLGPPREDNGVLVTAWGIDALAGRIFFAVETPEMLPKMQSWLVSKGVPCRLVVLRVMGQARLNQSPAPPTRRLTNVAADKHFRMRLRRNGDSVHAAELRR